MDENVKDQNITEEKETSTEESHGLEEKKDAVSYDTHRKLLGQRKRDQKELEEIKTRLSDYERKEKEAEEQKLNEEGEFKKLLELREKEIQSLSQERDEAKGQLIEGVKLQTFLNKLPGKLRSRDYLSHVDLDKIVIDPTTGEVDDSSVKEVVDEFVKHHPFLIETKSDGPKLPNNHPGSTISGKIHIEDWKKLSHDEKKKRMKDIVFN